MQSLELMFQIEFDCGGMRPLDWEYQIQSWKLFLEKILLDGINEIDKKIKILEMR